MRHTLGMLVAGMLVVAGPPLGAQGAAPARFELSALGGAFNYDAGGDAYSPMLALRAGALVNRFVRVEAGLGYARVTGESYRFHQSDPVPAGVGVDVRRVPTPVATADVNAQLQLPLRWAQPYLGAGYGVFSLDERRLAAADRWAGPRLTGASRIAQAGVRVPVGERLALRAELRIRLDRHTAQYDAMDVEQTAGLAYRF